MRENRTERDKEKTQFKFKIVVYSILLIVFVAIFGYCTFELGMKYGNRKEAKKNMTELQSSVNDVDETTTPKTEDEEKYNIPEKNLDFENLRATQNADIYAWINIPETNVDYPIVQNPTDDFFYLMHNLDGSYGYPGCLYTELQNSKDFTDKNTVIYGHDMSDGTMFKTLHNFEDQSFFDSHRYIYVYTEAKTYVYEIFAAYTFSSIHLLNGYDISTDESFIYYVNEALATAHQTGHVREGIDIDGATSKIITLSTCEGMSKNQRYLVQGVLVN